MLLVRIYEVFPLLCPVCGGTMKIVVFIDEGEAIREIIPHLGESVDSQRIALARGPPLLEAAERGGGDLTQPPPEFEFDQWWRGKPKPGEESGALEIRKGAACVCCLENET